MAKKVPFLLLKPLPPKGNAGDVIEVKTHYALHVLIPQGVGVIYDKQVQNQFEAQKKQIEKNKAEYTASIKSMLDQLTASGAGLTFEKAATDTDGLYDSISSKDIAAHLNEVYHVKLANSMVEMEKIESLGEYEAVITHEDQTVNLPIHVVKAE